MNAAFYAVYVVCSQAFGREKTKRVDVNSANMHKVASEIRILCICKLKKN